MENYLDIFLVFMSAGLLSPSQGASSSYRWPLANYTGGTEVDHGNSVGKIGCTMVSGPNYALLGYDSLFFSGAASSYVELDIGSENILTDWTFVLVIYISDIAGGTIFHLLYDGPTDSSSTLYSDEIQLKLNETHITLVILGSNGEDFGTVEVLHGLAIQQWIWLVVSHQANNGNTIIRTVDTILYESLAAQDNIFFHQPAKIKLGGSYGDQILPFTGSILCVSLYNLPLSYNDLKMAIYYCRPQYWNTVPTNIGLPLSSCPEYLGYFTKVSTDVRPVSSLSPIYTTDESSVRQCASTCLKDTLCKSISYGKTNRTCKTYTSVFDTNLQSETGTHYYKRRDGCCFN